MKQNVTLSAEPQDIRLVRARALQNGTTLNAMFQAWLKQQAAQDRITLERFGEVMKQLSHARAGRTFTRDEMNEH